jgi:hypothetical protein
MLAVAVVLAAFILDALLSRQSTRLKHEPTSTWDYKY